MRMIHLDGNCIEAHSVTQEPSSDISACRTPSVVSCHLLILHACRVLDSTSPFSYGGAVGLALLAPHLLLPQLWRWPNLHPPPPPPPRGPGQGVTVIPRLYTPPSLCTAHTIVRVQRPCNIHPLSFPTSRLCSRSSKLLRSVLVVNPRFPPAAQQRAVNPLVVLSLLPRISIGLDPIASGPLSIQCLIPSPCLTHPAVHNEKVCNRHCGRGSA